MIRKFLLILVTLFMISSTLFATDSQSPADDSLYTQVRLKNAKPETYDKLDLTCRGIVAKTSSGVELKTQIVDFDIEKGITYCQIYKKDNPEYILSTNADAQWLLYRKTENKQLEKEKAVTKIQSMSSSIGKKDRKFI